MVLSRAASEKDKEGETLDPVFANRYMSKPVLKNKFPDDELPKEVAFQVVADILEIDGRPRLNLASFVSTWMEPEADKLMMSAMNKNAIDLAQYPACSHIQDMCINMVARLFHAPLSDGQQAVGTATVGSSEAIMLAGLAMKRRWQHFRRHRGLPDDQPNIVIGANAHVAIEKFANYFDIQLRSLPVSWPDPTLQPEAAATACDERTIGVMSILGSTYTGHFEDVKRLNECLEGLQLPHGWQVPIHVDAASGGFVAPFLYPEVEWDFRLSRVHSINASGHKYGLTYPGIAWAIWRSHDCLPADLIFHVSYLGQQQPTFTLNFSRGAAQLIGQYYQFLRLGFEGYRKIMQHCASVADYLRERLEATGLFTVVSDASVSIPLVAFHFKNEHGEGYSEEALSNDLRRHGWILPSYSMPPDLQATTILRVCVREDFSQQLAEWLVTDIENTIKTWDASRKQQEKLRERHRVAWEKEKRAVEEGKEEEKEEGTEEEKEEGKEKEVERPEMKEGEVGENAKQKDKQRMVEGTMFPPATAMVASSGAVWDAMGKHGGKVGDAQRAKEHPIC